MAFLDISEDERRQMGISDGMIRVSVGIEDIDDLIEDFDRALALV
jgi:O-acetylhomoserine (thiol)-lyase